MNYFPLSLKDDSYVLGTSGAYKMGIARLAKAAKSDNLTTGYFRVTISKFKSQALLILVTTRLRSDFEHLY